MENGKCKMEDGPARLHGHELTKLSRKRHELADFSFLIFPFPQFGTLPGRSGFSARLLSLPQSLRPNQHVHFPFSILQTPVFEEGS